jgi:tol-pal system protein YbgF
MNKTKWVAFCLLLTTTFGVHAETRIALVIGNAVYQKSPALKNSANDAADMASKLKSVGFSLVGVRAHLNVSRTEMARLLRDFGDVANDGDTALFYYAGHGVAFNGDNWLLPVDDLDIRVQEDVPDFAMSSKSVVARMEQRGGGTNIIILDACRNNPLPDRKRSVGGTRGLQRLVDVPTGTFVLYAASENQAALDGDGRNGLFTGVLLKLIGQPGLRLEDIYYQTLDQVSRSSRNQQEPMAELKLTRPFYFVTGVAASSPSQQPVEVASVTRPNVPVESTAGSASSGNGSSDPLQVSEDEAAYKDALDSLKAGAYSTAAMRLKDFMARYPTSPLAASAEYWLGRTYSMTNENAAALSAFGMVLQRWPYHRKAPDAMLGLGNMQNATGRAADALATLTPWPR